MIKKIKPLLGGALHHSRALVKKVAKSVGINAKISSAEALQLTEIEKKFPRVLSTQETLEKILANNATLCRFGDAEFDVSNFENKNDPYQKPSEELSKRLREILAVPSSKSLIICIPPFNPEHNNPKGFYKNISFWEWYWLNRYEKLSPYFIHEEYGNSFVSRDAVFYENDVEKIKKLWNGRKVVFVVGKGGRFIFDERLFGTITSKDTIHVPPTSAYDEYDRILSEAKSFSKDHLFLIAAGPTATLLAYDLHMLGYQALDIGHISNCYRQFLGEAGAPESIPMKGNA